MTAADRRPLPDAYRAEDRHRGYRAAERERPFAKYFADTPRPPQPHVVEALAAGAAPTSDGYEVDVAADRLAAAGYERLETGWTVTDRGTRVVACRTDMPGVTAAMWDWWFGWHSSDTARYKLWHPGAHLFAALGEDRSRVVGLTDAQRYLDNVSYVDEYIGARKQRLAIRFVDPGSLGFAASPGTLYVCARVGLSELPVAVGWLVHQVRPTIDGSEMRSRFFLGPAEIIDVPAGATSRPLVARLLASRPGVVVASPVVPRVAQRIITDRFGRDLLEHCAVEMNHLAGFLPALYDEFGQD